MPLLTTDRPRQIAILFARGAMSAYECARRMGVDHTYVRRIWRGIRWTPDVPRKDAIMMIQRSKGEWVPATRHDEETLAAIAGPSAHGTPGQLVALAALEGLAVVFRGDLPGENP